MEIDKKEGESRRRYIFTEKRDKFFKDGEIEYLVTPIKKPPNFLTMPRNLLAKISLCAAIPFISSQEAFSQAAKPPVEVGSYAVSLYRQATNAEAHLYNGTEYVDYRKLHREGHQFFQVDQFNTGSVVYDGDLYEEVPMLYDVVRDEVVIELEGLLLQKLVTEKVTSFELLGHKFMHQLASDSAKAGSLRPGFYDVLNDGGIDFLVKRKKQMDNTISDKVVIEHYNIDDRFYLRNGETYQQVKSKRSVYKVLSDKHKELKKFARANRLNFRHQREASILALVKHYDSLR